MCGKIKAISTVAIMHEGVPEGISRSKLAAGVEQVLGVAVTARNWNTISKSESMLGYDAAG